MNSDANIAVHLFIGPNVNDQQNLSSFVEFFLPVAYLVDHRWNASYHYQCCGKVLSTWIKVPYSPDEKL